MPPICRGWRLALCGYLLRTALYNGALAISHRATFSILKTIRRLLLAKLPRLPLGTVMDTSSGRLKQIIVDQVDSMETALAHLFPEMTANITAPVLTLVFLLVLDWRLALLSLAVFPVAFEFMMTIMGGCAKDYAGAVQATKEMNGAMIEYIHGIEVIKAFNQGKTSYARLADKVRANAQYYYDWMRRSQLGMSMAYAFFPAQMLTVLPFGWLFYLHGTLSAGTFITVIILSLGMSGPIVAAFNFVDTLAQVGTTVEQVDEILKAEEQAHGEKPAALTGSGVEVKNVSFGYHDGKEILHGVSLTIPQNSMTALVGPSSSGKSTLAKLIAGFWDVKSGSITMGGCDLRDIPLTQLYDQVAFVSQDNYEKKQILRDVSVTLPDRTTTAIVGSSGSGKTTFCDLVARFWDVDGGSVKIGGSDVRDYTLESLMDQISMVFQDVYLFADTIENNIRFGCPNATREQVMEAARRACCDDFIEALPDGYDTVIGEGGASLSGGEKQRISIARAMLKDAPIIILDEATANVDPENEDRLQKAIEALTHEKTVLMIAHRLKTVRGADQILILADGKIVQRGRHEELMAQPGIYADFVGGRQETAGWKL